MSDKIYNFKITMNFKKRINRNVEVPGAFNLRQLADAFVSCFDFNFDHAFAFHNNIKGIYKSSKAYSSLYDDCGMFDDSPMQKSVNDNFVHSVFEPGKKMIFLFDYGDEWFFLIECLGVQDAKAGVTKVRGEAPKQYPGSDDESV